MYGLPNNVNLDFFSGRMVQQVCIGEHDVILHFDGDVSLSLWSRLRLTSPNSSILDFEAGPDAAAHLMPLLSRSVTGAASVGDGTLSLSFEGDHTLSVFDDSSNYESYAITHGKTVIVV